MASSVDGRRDRLIELFESRDARIGVVGLGYVGLPVAVAFAMQGFDVLGVDSDSARVHAIKRGSSYLQDIDGGEVAALVAAGRLRASSSYRGLSRTHAVLVCVPTPLRNGTPDLLALERAVRGLAKVLAPGALLIVESTSYPGTTEELVRPALEQSGLRAERDIFLAFSPERIDPGNSHYRFADIPKVVGGISPDSTRAAESLYSQVVSKVVTVSGTREAEMAKLVENTFRHVNIALVNELAVYAHELGVDIWEAIEAAATKPFGFIPFWPGPGWGGHCIPLDPTYLSWRVRQDRSHEVRFVELAHQINSEMPRYVVERIGMLLNERGKTVKGARILGIGLAYKGATEDTRGSAGIKVLKSLAARGAQVSYHDPLVQAAGLGDGIPPSDLDSAALEGADLVVTLVPQIDVDWNLVVREAPLVLDCCNAVRARDPRVVRL